MKKFKRINNNDFLWIECDGLGCPASEKAFEEWLKQKEKNN